MNTGTIPLPPVLAPVRPAEDVVIADCCGATADSMVARINGVWHVFIWNRQQRGNETIAIVIVDRIKNCPYCDEPRALTNETPTRRYHWGRQLWLDKAVNQAAAALH